MDKNAIKKYAVWARRELIERVSQRALVYGITGSDAGDPNAESVNGHLLSQAEKRQRQALIRNIKEKGYEQVMEEVAYTWFNRFAALRFMEVNGYLPSHIRVFTNDAGEFKPQILAEAIHLELDGLDMNKVYELESSNKSEELFKYLLIVQCNALNSILPGMFQRIEDYTELLLPDYLLREGSIIHRLVSDIDESDFDVHSGTGQVEIIGWLYQYYNDEKKAAIIDMAGKTAIKKEDIPAATQLFTTDWVVRYIVDNSLGRYWMEHHPNSRLKEYMEFYVEPTTHKKPDSIRVSPEQLTFFDPCIGSGHFALYAFSIYMHIYAECGYSDREAVAAIIENNLYGLDIDDRAAQLAYFSVMMKAREYDRRFFARKLQPHIVAIAESNHIDNHCIQAYSNGDTSLENEVRVIINELHDAKNLGSLLNVKPHNFEKLFARLDSMEEEISLFSRDAAEMLRPVFETAQLLSGKYTVVATNPPYLNKYNDNLKNFLYTNYKEYAGDLFSAFMYRNFGFCVEGGYSGFMTPFVWMFIKLYQKLREYIVNRKSIVTLVQMEYSAFEEATVPICAFVLQNGRDYQTGYYFQLSEFKGGMAVQKEKVLEALADDNCRYFYETPLSSFLNIPASPITYWANEIVLDSFRTFKPLGEYAEIVSGMTTGNNDKYMRDWKEVDISTIAFHRASLDEVDLQQTYWFPYNKGGAFRRWYGNNDYVVNWSKSHEFNRAKTTMTYLYLKPCITWSDITSAVFSARACGQGFFFDVKGSCAFPDERTYYPLIAFLNSKIAMMYIKMLNPTISTQVGDLKRIPFNPAAYNDKLVHLAKKCVDLGKEDYDSYEVSWDFEQHPLTKYGVKKIAEAFTLWRDECQRRFDEMKEAEGEMNRFFIDLYDMGRYMTADNEDKYVSIHLADKKADVLSFISYAIGCMFGRYSLDVPGLVCAGGTWDASKYTTFQSDKDAIIPICDDEYFEDDIVGRFVKFVEVVYGKEDLEENLRFIADALGGKGSSREVIRNYFINDFYADHLKVYQKRPIYWLFDSGKKNGFKCLIYMHRYQPDTIARIRTDYVHEQQSRYRTAIADLEQRINGASTSERVKLSKQLAKLQAQAEEIRVYEEKIHHLADQMIKIDLDDGVKHNYEIFKDVLAKIK